MIRAMSLQDVDAVLVIEQAVQAYPWTRGNFADVLQHGDVCRIDEEQGEVLAYAVMRLLPDEAELLNIGVAFRQQRNGRGRAILHAMLEVAQDKNLRRIFLEVRSSNAAALALYRSTGFSRIGERRGYYQSAGGSADAITMAYELKQHLSSAEARPGEQARPGEHTNG